MEVRIDSTHNRSLRVTQIISIIDVKKCILFQILFSKTLSSVYTSAIDYHSYSYHRHYNFHPLEVVSRGSETQLQVGENLNQIITGKQRVRHFINHNV